MDNNTEDGTKTNNNTESHGKKNAAPVTKRQSQAHRNYQENESARYYREAKVIQVEMGWTPDKNNRQQMDQKTNRVAAKNWKEEKRKTKEKMAR